MTIRTGRQAVVNQGSHKETAENGRPAGRLGLIALLVGFCFVRCEQDKALPSRGNRTLLLFDGQVSSQTTREILSREAMFIEVMRSADRSRLGELLAMDFTWGPFTDHTDKITASSTAAGRQVVGYFGTLAGQLPPLPRQEPTSSQLWTLTDRTAVVLTVFGVGDPRLLTTWQRADTVWLVTRLAELPADWMRFPRQASDPTSPREGASEAKARTIHRHGR